MPRINPPSIFWMTCMVLPSSILRLRRKSRISGIPNIHLMVQISPVFFFESACVVSLLFVFSTLYSQREYLVNKNNWNTLLTKVCVQNADFRRHAGTYRNSLMHAIAIEATATMRFSRVWLIFVAFLLPAKTPIPCATRSTGRSRKECVAL